MLGVVARRVAEHGDWLHGESRDLIFFGGMGGVGGLVGQFFIDIF